jgi:hypothetical protein
MAAKMALPELISASLMLLRNRGRTGFDRGNCGKISGPVFHQTVKRWALTTAEDNFALAA